MQLAWDRLTGFAKRVLHRLFVQRRVSAAQSRAVDIAKSGLSTQEKFETIYRERIWAKASPTILPSSSSSGHGSTDKSTLRIRSELPQFFVDFHIASLFDAPCGDFNWMKSVNLPSSFLYTGGDIVAPLIADLQSIHGTSQRRFVHFDLTRNQFPKADAWLCKDCLQHLSHGDVARVLINFSNSSIKWALISNHVDVIANTDICTGDFRHLDLRRPPFNLPEPLLVLRDSPIDGEPRGIFVWSRQSIKEMEASLSGLTNQ